MNNTETARHTPGPWRIRKTHPSCSDIVYEILDPYDHLPLSTLTNQQIDRLAVETDEANAALLAAAPDLYAALEHIAHGMGNLPIEQMGPAGVSGPNDGKMRAIYLEEYVRLARAAIAKVEETAAP